MQQTPPSMLYQRSSIVALLLANAVTIGLAYFQQWDFVTVLWVYWLQSVIIGIFQAKKISDLRQFSTKNFKINNQSVEPTEKTKKWVVRFFLFHFNFFLVVYLIFLLQRPEGVFWSSVLIGVGTFFVNHIFSYRRNKLRDQTRVPNIGTMMFFPYARIVPMHIIIIIGATMASTTAALLLFLCLKTVADVGMHAIEHRVQV